MQLYSIKLPDGSQEGSQSLNAAQSASQNISLIYKLIYKYKNIYYAHLHAQQLMYSPSSTMNGT